MFCAESGFRTGQTVVMVDRRTGEAAEAVRVAGVAGGEVRVEGYTARFSAADGTGRPVVQGRIARSAEVVDLSGRTLREAGDDFIPVRQLEPRHDIRRATAADLRDIAERDEARSLASEMSRFLATSTNGGGSVRLRQLRAAARALGITNASSGTPGPSRAVSASLGR